MAKTKSNVYVHKRQAFRQQTWREGIYQGVTYVNL